MTTNAKLSRRPIPEGEERFLEDGVFPLLYGCIDEGAEPPPLEPLDVEADAAEVAAGREDVLLRHGAQCHDLALWHQTVGTPYGYYLLNALQAQSRLLQSCCLRIATHFPGFLFEVPIHFWFQESSKDWAERVKSGADGTAPLQVLVKSLRTHSSLEEAVGALAGTSTITLRAVRNPMVLLDRWLGGTEDLAIALPHGASPEDPACPSEAGLSIGGNAVMKGAAKAASFAYLARIDAALEKAGAGKSLAAHFKASVFDLRTLALFDERLVGRRPPSDARLLTFLAASDLALFTPLHPIFAFLRDGLRWADLHPGHRLIRAIEVVKERGLELASTDAWAYWRFASAVCQALKWPEVTRFLDAARGREKEGPEDHLGKLFRAACAEREVNPCAFVDPFEGMAQLGKLRPPASSLAGFASDGDTDDALSFAIEGELYALGFQLLYSNKPLEYVCGQTREVLEQVDSAASMVRTYFGLEL